MNARKSNQGWKLAKLNKRSCFLLLFAWHSNLAWALFVINSKHIYHVLASNWPTSRETREGRPAVAFTRDTQSRVRPLAFFSNSHGTRTLHRQPLLSTPIESSGRVLAPNSTHSPRHMRRTTHCCSYSGYQSGVRHAAFFSYSHETRI